MAIKYTPSDSDQRAIKPPKRTSLVVGKRVRKPNGSFDKRAYQRVYMRKWRAKLKLRAD